MKFYHQCKLQRGTTFVTAWIEERGARVDAVVQLLPDRDKLWVVVEVAEVPKLREDQLKEIQLLNRGSLPSIERIGS